MMRLDALVAILPNLILGALSLGQQGVLSTSVGEYGPENLPPKPYSFNYEVKDDLGNVHFRREHGDPTGTVTGSYGYMHVNGLYRTVEYVADTDGFKARIQSNEPGVGKMDSADVQLTAEPGPLLDVQGPKIPTVKPKMGLPMGYASKKG